jgi:hypothetical protein
VLFEKIVDRCNSKYRSRSGLRSHKSNAMSWLTSRYSASVGSRVGFGLDVDRVQDDWMDGVHRFDSAIDEGGWCKRDWGRRVTLDSASREKDIANSIVTDCEVILNVRES